ncbi:MAG: hypothetical protein IPM51_11910 [Sphingobacteriaceae bacterium]|nr:hypothetical protein [Sphingobacteriaceae bacterium]
MTKLITKINSEISIEYSDTQKADGSIEKLLLKRHLAHLNLDEDTAYKAYTNRLSLTTSPTTLDLTALNDVFGNTLFSSGVKFLYLHKPAPADIRTITFDYNGVEITLGDLEYFIVSGSSTIKQLITTPSLVFTASGNTVLDIILIGN